MEEHIFQLRPFSKVDLESDFETRKLDSSVVTVGVCREVV
jgi:hypothetical protein